MLVLKIPPHENKVDVVKLSPCTRIFAVRPRQYLAPARLDSPDCTTLWFVKLSHMQQFKSTRLTEVDPELSEENVARRILEGGCKDIGVVLSLSQAMSYNIRLDAESVLGVTKIDLGRAETKDRKSNSVFESQQKDGSNSYQAPPSTRSPETPLSMAKRLQMLEMGKREMDEVNDSLKEMLEELDF